MRFIGLRHGQSVYNLLHLCNDDPARDVPLSDLGVSQARDAAQALCRCELSAIHCSPLPRTVQTARIVNEVLRLPLLVEPGLADIRSGFDGRPVADYLAAIAHDPLNARVRGGESLRDHFQRVGDCLDSLVSRGADRVLLVAHEETLRVFRAWSEGLPLEQVVGRAFANCQPYGFGGLDCGRDSAGSGRSGH